jgi:hypothetical protein
MNRPLGGGGVLLCLLAGALSFGLGLLVLSAPRLASAGAAAASKPPAAKPCRN